MLAPIASTAPTATTTLTSMARCVRFLLSLLALLTQHLFLLTFNFSSGIFNWFSAFFFQLLPLDGRSSTPSTVVLLVNELCQRKTMFVSCVIVLPQSPVTLRCLAVVWRCGALKFFSFLPALPLVSFVVVFPLCQVLYNGDCFSLLHVVVVAFLCCHCCLSLRFPYYYFAVSFLSLFIFFSFIVVIYFFK